MKLIVLKLQYILQIGLKSDNVENSIFSLPNLELSAALQIYQAAERYMGLGAGDKQERGIMYGWCGGTRTWREIALRGMRTRREKQDSVSV